jgi:hypothetical protein
LPTVSISSDFEAQTLAFMDSDPEHIASPPGPGGSVVYFDGRSSRRRPVTLAFSDQLELHELQMAVVHWPYDDIRRADGPAGTLRLTCLTAPALARLEVRDAALATELTARCSRLDENAPGRGAAAIVAWSLAAAVSIITVILFGVPLAADRLTPLVPQSFERRLGDVADGQVRIMFGNKVCNDAAGQAAFTKLVKALRDAAGLDPSVQTAVLATPIPNAFALPGGKVYLFNGLLARAQDPDEIAGVLAHELGHQASRRYPQPDLQRGHLVPDRFAVWRRHRVWRHGLCVAHAGDRVLFARGRARRR